LGQDCGSLIRRWKGGAHKSGSSWETAAWRAMEEEVLTSSLEEIEARWSPAEECKKKGPEKGGLKTVKRISQKFTG